MQSDAWAFTWPLRFKILGCLRDRCFGIFSMRCGFGALGIFIRGRGRGVASLAHDNESWHGRLKQAYGHCLYLVMMSSPSRSMYSPVFPLRQSYLMLFHEALLHLPRRARPISMRDAYLRGVKDIEDCVRTGRQSGRGRVPGSFWPHADYHAQCLGAS